MDKQQLWYLGLGAAGIGVLHLMRTGNAQGAIAGSLGALSSNLPMDPIMRKVCDRAQDVLLQAPPLPKVPGHSVVQNEIKDAEFEIVKPSKPSKGKKRGK
jgi:hypothetical protein